MTLRRFWKQPASQLVYNKARYVESQPLYSKFSLDANFLVTNSVVLFSFTELDNLYNCSCESALLNETACNSGGIRKMSLYKPGDPQLYQLYHAGIAGRNAAASPHGQ